jgi:hypothetical protein
MERDHASWPFPPSAARRPAAAPEPGRVARVRVRSLAAAATALAVTAGCRALGALHAATGAAHGDCAPWNLLETADGFVLVDWEESSSGAPPFSDVLHYLGRVQTHLGRISRRRLSEGLLGRGWAGAAFQAYADGAGLELGQAAESLRRSMETLPEPTPRKPEVVL